MTEVHGHCLCGKVTYTFHSKTPELQTAACHCDSCQRWGGSTYSYLIFAGKDDLKVNGPVKVYTETADSGRKVFKHFCPECGTSVVHEPEVMHPNILVLAGTVDKDQKKNLQAPGVEVYTKAKLPFVNLNAPKAFVENAS